MLSEYCYMMLLVTIAVDLLRSIAQVNQCSQAVTPKRHSISLIILRISFDVRPIIIHYTLSFIDKTVIIVLQSSGSSSLYTSSFHIRIILRSNIQFILQTPRTLSKLIRTVGEGRSYLKGMIQNDRPTTIQIVMLIILLLYKEIPRRL